MDSLIYFKALADATRLRLINILAAHELKVGEMVEILAMGQSRISRHLKILGDAGLLESRRDGVWGFYAVAGDGPARRFIDAICYLFEADTAFAEDRNRTKAVLEQQRLDSVRFFDKIAETWGRLKKEIIGDFDLNRAICSDLENFSTAVDLGCGTGDLLLDIASHAAKVIGVDSSPRMLAEARKRFAVNGEKIEIRLGEIEHLPLGDAEADLAVISLVLQYIENPEKAISEAARILKPGGIFVITEFDKHDYFALKHKYGARWPGFTKVDIRRLLEANGFTMKNISTYPLAAGLVLQVFTAKKSNGQPTQQ